MRVAFSAKPALLVTVILVVAGLQQRSLGQSPAQGVTRICVLSFEKDAQRPARVENSAAACLTRARAMLAAETRSKLYLVGAADKIKDNKPEHGRIRTEQDMSGEDLRYADVAAYRAVNTKAYLVRWLNVDPTRVIPVTSYEDGQQVEVFLVKQGTCFERFYGKETAPILAHPCTVTLCSQGQEEFLIAQQRDRIPSR